MSINKSVYSDLLQVRSTLRAFLKWSESEAKKVGLTPSQHQLLLAVKGHLDTKSPTIKDISNYLLTKHNSVVELINRSVTAGLLEKIKDSEDSRVTRLRLTKLGDQKLTSLSQLHLEELKRLSTNIYSIWNDQDNAIQSDKVIAGKRGVTSEDIVKNSFLDKVSSKKSVSFELIRVYEKTKFTADQCVLIDGLWPRGISKKESPFSLWCKSLAPSKELRTYYGHDPKKYKKFGTLYLEELNSHDNKADIDTILDKATNSTVALMTATKDLKLSHGTILIPYLTELAIRRKKT